MAALHPRVPAAAGRPTHCLKLKSGVVTQPSASGTRRCLLVSEELPGGGTGTAKSVTLSSVSRGSRFTWTGKQILQESSRRLNRAGDGCCQRPPPTSGCQKRAQQAPPAAGTWHRGCHVPPARHRGPTSWASPPGVGYSRLLLRPGKVAAGQGGVPRTLTSSRLLPGGPRGRGSSPTCPGSPGHQLHPARGAGGRHGGVGTAPLGTAPLSACPSGAQALSKIIPVPSPPPGDTANARHGEGSARPPRLLPGLFWEQIPFPGCKQAAPGTGRLAPWGQCYSRG